MMNHKRHIRFTEPFICGRRTRGGRAGGAAWVAILALASAGGAVLAAGTAGPSRGAASPVVQRGETPGGASDPCRLIASKEIEKVLGEPVLEAVRSGRTAGRFAIAQCYYRLPSHTKSVSLEVTRADPAAAPPAAARERWKEVFHGPAAREEESGRPRPIAGLGEEAFWTGDAQVGALYVLDDAAFLRISIGGGGAEAESVRISKSRALAARAIGRL